MHFYFCFDKYILVHACVKVWFTKFQKKNKIKPDVTNNQKNNDALRDFEIKCNKSLHQIKKKKKKKQQCMNKKVLFFITNHSCLYHYH